MANRLVLPFADVGSGISPSAGAQLFFFETGTSDKKDTFSDRAGKTPNPNPVVANQNGRFPAIFIEGEYKVVLQDKKNNQIWEEDPVFSFISSDVADTLVDLKAVTGQADGEVITITGHTTPGDGGGGDFWFDADSAETDNNGTIVEPDAGLGRWLRIDASTVADVRWFGAVGDGVTDDTTAIQNSADAFPLGIYGRNGTFLVTIIPTGTLIFDINLLFNSETYDYAYDNSLIQSDTDTGGLVPAFTGGANDTPTISGRTTPDDKLVLGSQNCRAQFVRSSNMSSIYSWAYGNVSGNYSSRQSVAGCPQSINTASEECEVYGFRGANVASIFSEIIASTGFNAASRLCSASSTHAVNVGSNTSQIGAGKRARLLPVVVGGEITSITIEDGGDGYVVANTTLSIVDRSSVSTIDATATFTVDGSGIIDSITMTNVGAGYVDDPVQTVAFVLNNGGQLGNYSTELCTATDGENLCNSASRRSTVSGTESGNFATNDCDSTGISSGNIASDICTVSGETSGNIASAESSVSGDASANLGCILTTNTGLERSVCIASTGSTSTATGGLVLSGNIADAEHVGSIVMGRRVKSAQDRSIVFGDNAAGAALTANRKFEVTTVGDINIAGVLSPNTIFTDYGEYFENLENGVIPFGTIVCLKGKMIAKAESGDDILGVISATACIRAGDTKFHWAARYLVGDYGELLTEEVDCVYFKKGKKEYSGLVSEFNEIPKKAKYTKEMLPIENPDYDGSLDNTPRSERPNEWSLVGLIGQIHVRVNADAKPNDYISENGAVSSKNTKIRVMNITSKKQGFNIAKCLVL